MLTVHVYKLLSTNTVCQWLQNNPYTAPVHTIVYCLNKKARARALYRRMYFCIAHCQKNTVLQLILKRS